MKTYEVRFENGEVYRVTAVDKETAAHAAFRQWSLNVGSEYPPRIQSIQEKK